MNSEEPFTSVNWDRDEPAGSTDVSNTTETAKNRVKNNGIDGTYQPNVHNSPIKEEQRSALGSPRVSAAFPLDSSSMHSKTVPTDGDFYVPEFNTGDFVNTEDDSERKSTESGVVSGELPAVNAWGSDEKTGAQSIDTNEEANEKIHHPADPSVGSPKKAATSPSLAAESHTDSPVSHVKPDIAHIIKGKPHDMYGSEPLDDSADQSQVRVEHKADHQKDSVGLDGHITDQTPDHPESENKQVIENDNDPQPFNQVRLTEDVATPEISDQQKMEADFSTYTIDSHVSNPISDRDGNSKPFISYLVTTSTNHPEVLRLSAAGNGPASSSAASAVSASDGTMVKVRRRYGDFRFLHDCLISDFPQLLVPPLPAKSNFKYLTGDTFSTAFVHKRLHSLDRFITFICQHKLLSQSSVFHYFISDSSEWASFTKNLKILKGEDGDGSIVGKVVNEDLLTETIMNFFTPSKHKKETNKDILEISDKLKKLYENLVKLERIFSKLNKKNLDLKNDYESFSNQINKLASLHESTSQLENGAPQEANASFASSIDTTQISATSNFKIFSESLLFFSENWAGLGRYIDESFLVSLKDCAKYIARLSSLIELHHNKKIDLQVLEEYLSKAKGDLANIGGPIGYSENSHRAPPPNPTLIGQNSGSIVTNTTQLIKDTLSTSATPHIGSSQSENKKIRLQQKIHHLESEIAAQTQLVNSLTSRIINEEYPNWDRFNKTQMKNSMSDLCDQEISFYKGLVDNWTDVETKLVKRLEELK
ncbi:hypothetical protein JCM33374_g1247 [Metschnikowia sp. JCM 33374]|nr:hypothetical protein JCM33374_g1247 [Metschnikowia sp. JCM 33374]